jgi:hypothetical protein
MMKTAKVELNGGTDLEIPAKPEHKLRKIALVGTAPSSSNSAPYDDESWEIWTLGANVEKGRRITKLFELHTQHVLESAGSWNGLFPYLKEKGADVILGHSNSLLPDATPFPKDELIGKFGSYFTSSIAWMIGYAILQKPDCIGLWGIDMMGEEEYARQRNCCEYLLGIARGMNIVLSLADESPLLRSERLYAFEHTALSAGLNIMRNELKTAIAGMEANERKARDERKFYEGQMEMLKNIHKRFG